MAADDFVLDVAGQFVKIQMKGDLGRKIATGPKRVHDAAVITAHRMAPAVEAYAKNNAPWTDRTGNARNGLAARAYEEGESVGIVIYHQVPYGIFLELANDGTYAIIQPTIDAMGPKVMAAYEGLLGRI